MVLSFVTYVAMRDFFSVAVSVFDVMGLSARLSVPNVASCCASSTSKGRVQREFNGRIAVLMGQLRWYMVSLRILQL